MKEMKWSGNIFVSVILVVFLSQGSASAQELNRCLTSADCPPGLECSDECLSCCPPEEPCIAVCCGQCLNPRGQCADTCRVQGFTGQAYGECVSNCTRGGCGDAVCDPATEFCCNESCSICAPKGEACTQQICQ